MRDLNYRPSVIEFDFAHDNSVMPSDLGSFENAEEAIKFLSGSFVVFNTGLIVNRFMDHKEKTEIRKEYNELLENDLPKFERELSTAMSEFNEAKRKKDDCQEMVNATMNEARGLALEVKRGTVEIRLDDLFTYRLPYKGRYYYYTYMDKQLKLCAIRDIPEYEKNDIFNAMSQNDKMVDDNFNHKDDETEKQKGKEKQIPEISK